MIRSRWPWLVSLAILALCVGLAFGAVPLGFAGVRAGLFDGASPEAAIVRGVRLPRALLGFLVGGSLAVAGAVMQALIRNPLADPYLLGVSGGAGLAAVVVIASGVDSAWVLPLAAFAGALGAMLLVYRLGLVGARRLDPHVLLLSGVVVSAFATALIGAILALSQAEALRTAFLWMLGGLGAASWERLAILACYSFPALWVLRREARWLDLLALGDEQARHLGADPDRLRRIGFLTTGLLTAAAVATCGMIGFVGLVVPHAIRRVWGPLHRPLLPAAFLLGGAALVLADAVARSIAPPVELPVGVVTALAGVPVFIAVLRKTVR